MGLFSKVGLGIDIGTTSIKVVELARKGDVAKLESYGILENYAHLERINEAIQTSNFKIVEKTTAQYLSNLLKQSKIRSREANVSLPSFYTYMNLIELPILGKKEIEKAIYYQAKQYVPVAFSEIILD
jgi:Tfp pilus assembly PilM family ATPase